MKTFIKSIYNFKILLLLLCFTAAYTVTFTGCGKNNTTPGGVTMVN